MVQLVSKTLFSWLTFLKNNKIHSVTSLIFGAVANIAFRPKVLADIAKFKSSSESLLVIRLDC